MQIIAYQKFYRMSPRKLKLVADSVRSLKPTQALTQLQFMHKRAATKLHQVMKQAIANALDNKLKDTDLVIKHILVEQGPRYRRFRAASRGRARMIVKRTSHIKVILEGIKKPAQTKAIKVKQVKKISKS